MGRYLLGGPLLLVLAVTFLLSGTAGAQAAPTTTIPFDQPVLNATSSASCAWEDGGQVEPDPQPCHRNQVDTIVLGAMVGLIAAFTAGPVLFRRIVRAPSRGHT